MHSLSTPQFILKRLADNWKLLLSVFVGITVAAILMSGAPIYVKSLGRIGFLASIEQSPPLVLNILTTSPDVPIDRDRLTRVENSVEEAFQANVSPIYAGRNRSVKTDTVLLIRPAPIVPRPSLALVQDPLSRFEEAESPPSLGHFINAQDLVNHVTILRGRMPVPTLFEGTPPTYATIVEATIGSQLSDALGLDVGHEVLVSSASSTHIAALVRVVGVVEPIDPGEEFWNERADRFFFPSFGGSLPNPDTEIDRDRPMAAFIIDPEAAFKLPSQLAQPSRHRTLRANFANVTDLEEHVTLLEGRMPGDLVSAGPRGPVIEAVLGAPLVNEFGIHVGDVISLTPFLDEPTWVSVHVVGIAERTDKDDPYWLWGPNAYFVPGNPDEPAHLGVLITREAMVEGVAKAYPGSLASFVWYTDVDSGGFDDWSAEETRIRLRDLVADLAEALPGQLTSTGIDRLVRGFERKILLGSVPILLLVATIVVTVLYFASMMVSYLVRSRERDVALLKTRGISTPRMFRLYGVEGISVTVIAVAVAPLLALAAILLAGKLPHFDAMTGGDFLPVEIGIVPFLVAAGVGVLCLGVFIVPAVASARSGLVVLKLASSRPPAVPFFHRYYLDLGLMVVVGVIFWELHSRGDLVAGGLFEDIEVNETLLLAPVLLMVVVALLFSRFFPLVLKFISGESPALLHALAAATTVTLISGLVARDLLDGKLAAWIAPVAPLVAFAAVYAARFRAHTAWWRTLWLAAQIPFVAAYFLLEPLDTSSVLVYPAVALIVVVPGQVAFMLLESYARVAPVWVSLALWRMARNPLQYTWLVLLLVLVAGLATLSLTMGTTLEARDDSRIRYEVAADVRVTIKIPTDSRALSDSFVAIPGVARVSPAYRTGGAGKLFGGSFSVLAVNSLEFDDISWYRKDFSDESLDSVMSAVRPYAPPRPLPIPSGSAKIGVWAKLGESTPGLSLRMVVQDGTGAMRLLPPGEVQRDWSAVTADLPSNLAVPLRLAAIQVLPQKRLIGITNTVFLDDIHVIVGDGETVEVLDDFEGAGRWKPMPTSFEESDSLLVTTRDVHGGAAAAKYSVRQQNRDTAPGIYQSPSGGPLPVVVDSEFVDTMGVGVGEAFIASVDQQLVPMVVSAAVRFFPTMDERGDGFLLADFDQLVRHLDVRDPRHMRGPNELFIELSPGAGPQTRAQIHELSRPGIDVHDTVSISESFELNPLVTAGWRAVAFVSLAVVAFTALTGIVTYLVFFSDSNRGEMGVVRSLGLAHGQMINLLALEHMLIAVVGMGLGTWAGLRMSSMMAPLVSLAESGGDSPPPLLITTDWTALSVLYVAVAVTFATMLFVINRSVFRWDAETATRIEN
ncbi:MAG: ABC transporter permease [SAR202 cluster bacterium]|nr:ABC transporter permease [SAR202 cluster bacterium]